MLKTPFFSNLKSGLFLRATLTLAITLISTFVLETVAQGQTASLINASPRERHSMGYYLTGAISIDNHLSCSPTAVRRFVGPDIYPTGALLHFKSGISVPVDTYIRDFTSDLNQALFRLIRAGDSDLTRRYVCVGAYDYKSVNAMSYSAGYIFFDPMLVRYIYEELATRSMYSIKQVLYHELAHQFQYWYGNSYAKEPTAMRTELTADCVGAALSGHELLPVSDDIWNVSVPGIAGAVQSMGDFMIHAKGHHGTPTQRALAAHIGLNYIRTNAVRLQMSGKLNAINILRACEAEVLKL